MPKPFQGRRCAKHRESAYQTTTIRPTFCCLPQTPRTMPHRLAPLLAMLLAAPLLTAQAAELSTASYAVKPYGSTAADAQATRYSVSTSDYTWFDSQRGRSIPVRIYSPVSTSERFPVIIFSTGLGQSREDCAYLGHHWATCGYVSVHVQHKGSDEDVRQGTLRPRKELQKAFNAPQNVRNRPIDIIFVIDQLEQMQRNGSNSANRFDLTRIGVGGHDFGAQTVLGLVGQVLPGRIAFAESRVKAVLAISSPVRPSQVPLDITYGDINLPCLHITGTADNSVVATTQAYQRRLPFDHTSGVDQYLVTFFGADHMTYSGHIRAANGTHDAMFQHRIAECSAVFWDAYLKDDASAKAWLADDGLKAYLAAIARVEKKLTASSPLPPGEG